MQSCSRSEKRLGRDIDELFWPAHDLCTDCLVRTCVDRLADEGQPTMPDEIRQVKVNVNVHRVKVRDASWPPMTVTFEVRYPQLTVLPPVGEKNRYPARQLTLIHVHERNMSPACSGQRRRREAAHCQPPGELHRGVLHSERARSLAGDARRVRV